MTLTPATPTSLPDGSPQPSTGGELQALRAAERAGTPFLMFRDGQGTHTIVALPTAADSVTIGRHSQNDLALPWDERVSRVHARLERLATDWAVIDDGISRNGTFVDGIRVSARTRLPDGAVLRLGGTLLAFRDPGVRSGTMTAVADVGSVPEPLTEMQKKVLRALCRPYKPGAGLVSPATNAEIAAELYLSIDAVKTHMRSLFQKFAVGDLPQNQKRLRVVECAFQWGLVTERGA